MEVYPRSSAFIRGQFCFSLDSATFELPALQNRHRCPNLSILFFHLVYELRPHQCLRFHSAQNRLEFAKVPLECARKIAANEKAIARNQQQSRDEHDDGYTGEYPCQAIARF